jgi:hypothetical protein
MRTTIDLGEDIFYAAKAYAKTNKQTMGEVVTAWAREKFAAPDAKATLSKKRPSEFEVLGFRTLPNASGAKDFSTPVTNETINRLREQEGI